MKRFVSTLAGGPIPRCYNRIPARQQPWRREPASRSGPTRRHRCENVNDYLAHFTGVVNQDVTDSSGRVAIPRLERHAGRPENLGQRIALDLEAINVNGRRLRVASDANTQTTAVRTAWARQAHRKYVGGGAWRALCHRAIGAGEASERAIAVADRRRRDCAMTAPPSSPPKYFPVACSCQAVLSAVSACWRPTQPRTASR